MCYAPIIVFTSIYSYIGSKEIGCLCYVAPRSFSIEELHQRERFGAQKSVKEYPNICRNIPPEQHLLFSRAFNSAGFSITLSTDQHTFGDVRDSGIVRN